MRKSVFLRRAVLLLAVALIISSLLSATIYYVVTQRLFVRIHAETLMPTAQGIAQMVAAKIENPEQSVDPSPFLYPGRGDFLGAQLHVYSANGEVMEYSSMKKGPGGNTDSGINPGALDPGGPGANNPDAEGKPVEEAKARADLSEIISPALEKVYAGEEVAVYNARFENEGYVLVGTPALNSNGEIVGAVVFTKRISELNDSMRGLKTALFMGALAAFVLMLLPCYYFARLLAIPIRQMTDISLNMAKGDFSVRADESQKGEIGELAVSLNHFARESQRLEKTRQDYVSNVSHELRTPIAAIRAMSETLTDGLIKSKEKKDRYYQGILRESMRLSRLVDDLLELSRLQSGGVALKKSVFDLDETLEGIASIYGEMAHDTGLTFSLDIPGRLPKVFSNCDRVEQVLIALLDNAIKHTPEDGKVSLGAAVHKAHVDVWVEDTGEGIPTEDLPYVFDRFYKVDKAHSSQGTGLGLSIAKEIVQLLGEDLSVESTPGEGTRFVVSLQKANGQNKSGYSPGSPAQAREKGADK